MKSIVRRAFLKRSSQLGIASLAGSLLSAESFAASTIETDDDVKITKGPIAQVKREVHIKGPEPSLAPITNMYYVGSGLRRQETLLFMQSSDWHIMELGRKSEDNGRTWGPWIPIPTQTQTEGRFTQSGGASQNGTGPLDTVSGMLVKPVFQRIFQGKPEEALKSVWNGERLFWDHGYYQLSKDNGQTWGEAFQLKYEEGPDFDPKDWGKKDWLWSNEMYIGNAVALKNGTVLICATVPVPYKNEEDEKYPVIFPNNYRKGSVAGAMCFIGKWDKQKQNYSWKNSQKIFLPRKISSRGLVELDLSELKNGNLMMIMRGNDTPVSPGRKWFSVSKDGGYTWTEIKDMRYDTGEQFYSPASIHKTIRSSKTGKLYWVGNITNEPPKGNRPRYPLQIIEVNEEGPSFIKKTLTVLDDRDPAKDSELVQFSNFALFENRETNEIEMYLTRLGENKETWNASSYKYTIALT
jgi:hypothetical protein